MSSDKNELPTLDDIIKDKLQHLKEKKATNINIPQQNEKTNIKNKINEDKPLEKKSKENKNIDMKIADMLMKILFSNKFKKMIKGIVIEALNEQYIPLKENKSTMSLPIAEKKVNNINPTEKKENRIGAFIDKLNIKDNVMKNIFAETLQNNLNNPILSNKDNLLVEENGIGGDENLQYIIDNNDNIDNDNVISNINNEGTPEVNVDAFMKKFMKK